MEKQIQGNSPEDECPGLSHYLAGTDKLFHDFTSACLSFLSSITDWGVPIHWAVPESHMEDQRRFRIIDTSPYSMPKAGKITHQGHILLTLPVSLMMIRS